jgi:hypothetical protein
MGFETALSIIGRDLITYRSVQLEPFSVRIQAPPPENNAPVRAVYTNEIRLLEIRVVVDLATKDYRIH